MHPSHLGRNRHARHRHVAIHGKGLDPNGDEMILAFTKDDKGKITGCTVNLPARGIEAKATKTETK